MDEELRDLERAAERDPDAALGAARYARRGGRTRDAIAWLERAWLAGRREAGAPIVELFEVEPRSQQVSLAPLLDRLATAGVPEAAAAWSRAFPSLARIKGGSVIPALRAFVYLHAQSDTPVRIAGPCAASQELVARALHSLSGRRGILAVREDVAPSLQCEGIEYAHRHLPFQTLLLCGQSASHYYRLVEHLFRFSALHRIRVVLGIQSDAWDADQFRPFAEGVELEVPALQLDPVARDEVPSVLGELLHESGIDPPSDWTVLDRARAGAWDYERLFSIVLRCYYFRMTPGRTVTAALIEALGAS